jgi:hypothetical protein
MAEQDLKNQFPDISQSVFIDVLNACQGDSKKAQAIFQESAKNEEQDPRITELCHTFPDLKREEVEKVFNDNGKDVDASILPLFNLLQELNQKKRTEEDKKAAEKREAERNAKKAEAGKKMHELFKQVSPEEIQRIIDENDGDLSIVSERLAQLVAKQEDTERKAREEREKKEQEERKIAIFKALKSQFTLLSDQDIQDDLESCDYDSQKATLVLNQKDKERKVQEIANIFPSFTQNQAELALLENGWDMVKAVNYLHEQLNQKNKKIEEEKQRQEQQKRLEKERKELQKKMAKEIEIKQQEALKKEQQALEEKQKQLEEQKKQQELDLEHTEKRELSAEEIASKFDLFSLEQSKIIQQKIVEEFKVIKEDNQDYREILVEDIEKALRENPNLQPGTVEQKQDDDVEAYDFSSVIDRCKIRVSPSRPDLGQDITVSWTEYDSPAESDWISMNDAHTGEKLSWSWVGEASRDGKVTFKAQTLGEVVFCYVNKSKHIMAKSAPIFIGPEFEFKTEKIGEMKYALKFQQISGIQHANAWVGLYQKGASNENYYSYQWVANAVNLSLIFDIPKTGHWELRLFPLRNLIGKYIHVGSTSITIEGNDKLQLIIPEKEEIATIHYALSSVDTERDSVWIGLYLIQEIDNKQYRRYKKIKGPNTEYSKGTITFKKPIHSGVYEARLFAFGSLDIILKSNSVAVEGI